MPAKMSDGSQFVVPYRTDRGRADRRILAQLDDSTAWAGVSVGDMRARFGWVVSAIKGTFPL
ncbi:hypothetical protein GCM10011588_43800 [Nocardia jinanensis]|uniref:Uncharacterized protein n=1 Tax=Nocardia jinanensis TaxID=382504 RepID=A0A917VWY0_9NOCA|nr:hypothetical protein GCM10011588_43800 [Nocardia jinanensis]